MQKCVVFFGPHEINTYINMSLCTLNLYFVLKANFCCHVYDMVRLGLVAMFMIWFGYLSSKG